MVKFKLMILRIRHNIAVDHVKIFADLERSVHQNLGDILHAICRDRYENHTIIRGIQVFLKQFLFGHDVDISHRCRHWNAGTMRNRGNCDRLLIQIANINVEAHIPAAVAK